tara:strand:- start:430 stop:1431 length:1002 start_codon:yes stop_codon:yes gene_type:complete
MSEKLNLKTGEYEKVEVVADNLPAEMELEPTIDYTPLEISFNYDELKEMMVKGLQEYKLEVTADNIKDANKMATKLNKLAGTIKRARIDNKKEMLEPLTLFENNMKDLEETALMGREFLTSQVKVFNDGLIKICLAKCKEYLEIQYVENEILEEFQTVDISDIAIVSNLSNSMKLTKKAIDAIESRVNIALSKQISKKMRLMMLENECLKNGLQVLLNESDVSHFILESDLKYNEQLAILINRELEKQKQIELNITLANERKMEQEKRDKELKEKQSEFSKQQVSKSIGVKTVQVVAIFEMEVPTKYTNEQIRVKYEKRLKEFSETFKSLVVK